MDEKLKEMIAIGASVTANDIPCIRYHFTKAREVGLKDGEIKGAVQVGEWSGKELCRNGMRK